MNTDYTVRISTFIIKLRFDKYRVCTGCATVHLERADFNKLTVSHFIWNCCSRDKLCYHFPRVTFRAFTFKVHSEPSFYLGLSSSLSDETRDRTL